MPPGPYRFQTGAAFRFPAGSRGSSRFLIVAVAFVASQLLFPVACSYASRARAALDGLLTLARNASAPPQMPAIREHLNSCFDAEGATVFPGSRHGGPSTLMPNLRNGISEKCLSPIWAVPNLSTSQKSACPQFEAPNLRRRCRGRGRRTAWPRSCGRTARRVPSRASRRRSG